MACVVCYLEGGTVVQGPETSGKNPIEEMGGDFSRSKKLERVNSKLSKDKRADVGLDSASMSWETTFNAIKDALMVSDRHSTITQANPAASRLLGKSLEQIIGQSYWQVVHGTNRPSKECPFQKALTRGQREEAEFYLPEKGIWIEVAVDPIVDDQGRTNSAVYTLRDVTDRKKYAETLRKNEEKHRAIFEGAVDGIIYASRTARVIDVNPAFTRITGIPREDVVGKSAFHLARQFAQPKDIPRLLKAVNLALSGRPVELYELEINGRIVEISTPSLRNEKSGITGVIRDITERKRAQKNLRDSEENYRSIFENIVDVYYRADLEGNLLLFSPSGLKLLGYDSADDLEGKNLVKDFYYHPEDRVAFQKELAKHGRVDNYQVILRRKDGTPVFGETNSYLVYDRTGQPVAVEGIFRDISERKKAEEAYRSLVDRSLQGLAIFQEGHIVFANQVMAQITGYTVEEMLAMSPKKVRAFVHPEDREFVWNRHTQRMQGRLPPERYEFRGIRKDGSLRWFEIDANLVEYQGRPAIQVAYLDITERKNAEQREKEYIRQLQNLSESATEFVKLTPDEDIYSLIAKKVRELNKGCIVSVNTYDAASDLLCIRALVGLGKSTQAVTQIMGANPVGQCFPIDDAAKEGLGRGELVKVPGGIYDLSPNIPKVVCQAVEKLLGLGDVYAMGLTSEGRLYGSATILTRSKTGLENLELTETFMNQAAVAIHRWEDAVALQESKKRLIEAQHIARMGDFTWDVETGEVTWSDALFDLLHYDRSEKIDYARINAEIHHPEDLERITQWLNDCIANHSRELTPNEYRLIRKDGEVIYVRTVGVIERREGKPLKIFATIQDITERKVAERKLADNAAFQSVLATIRGVYEDQTEQEIWEVFLESLVVEYDFKMAWFGTYVEEQIKPLIWTGCAGTYLDGLVLDISEPTNPDGACAMSQCILSRQPFGYSDLAHDAGFRAWRQSALDHGFGSNMALPFIVDGRVEGAIMVYDAKAHGFSGERTSQLQSLVDDIAQHLGQRRQRERARRALQESEERLRSIIDHSAELFFIHDTEHKLIYVSPQSLDIFGYTPDEMKVRWTTLVTDSPINEEGFEFTERAIQTGERQEPYILEIKRKDGERRFLEIDESPVKNEEGEVVAISGALRDITERRRAEEALRQSEEFLNNVIENTPNPMWLSDEKGTVIRMNQALRELLKVTDEEIIGCYNVFKDRQLQEQGLLALVEKVFTEGQSAHFEMEYDTAQETQVELKERVHKTLEVTFSPLRNIEGVITNVICQHRDITDRKRAEAELQEYQAKLKAMASEILQTQERERQRLAIGLHDDICQKLVLAKLTLESSLRRVTDAQLATSLKMMTETIGETIRQAESLTFELSNPVLREFGFVAAVEKYLVMEIRSKHGIAYKLEADEHLGFLRDEIKTCLFRVTRELLTNVVKHAQARKVEVFVRKTQDEIHVTVQDDGVGFEPAEIKGEDSGSVRFGLFSVREQLEHLGGLLIIESKPGRGTVATVVI